jgi:hypothetical protein
MIEIGAKASLNPDSMWVGPAVGGSRRKAFRHVAEGTTVATECIKTKDGDLTEHNSAVARHRELAMSTRR